jgi:hypothetical protein
MVGKLEDTAVSAAGDTLTETTKTDLRLTSDLTIGRYRSQCGGRYAN